jgi:hypothetical protein
VIEPYFYRFTETLPKLAAELEHQTGMLWERVLQAINKRLLATKQELQKKSITLPQMLKDYNVVFDCLLFNIKEEWSAYDS